MSANPHAEANAKLAVKAAAEHKRRTGKASTKAPAKEAKSKQPPTKAEIAEARTKLDNIAAEANARFERADKELIKAEDHRLAAAIRLKEAEDLCKANAINFKEWCEKNISQRWDTARKYLGIAKQPDPQKALADMRAGAAKRNKKLRAKQKAQRKTSASTKTKPDVLAGYEAVKAAFAELSPRDQMNFVRWAATETGFKLIDVLEEAAAEAPKTAEPAGVAKDDGSDAPANLVSPRVRRTAAAAAA